MFLIDRSFENWKSDKLFALGQRVARRLRHSERFTLESELLNQLNRELAEVKAAKNLSFANKTEIKKAVKKKSVILRKTLSKVAASVEKQCELKSDIALSGFLPARIARVKK